MNPARIAAVACLLLPTAALAQTAPDDDPATVGEATAPVPPPAPAASAPSWSAPASPSPRAAAPLQTFTTAPYVPYLPTPRPVYSQGMGGVEIASLYATAALWGGGLGLWLADGAVRDDAGAHTVILPLLGVGAGVVAAVFIDRNAQVRRGRALAVHAGMWLGLTAGIGVVGAANLSFDRDEQNLATHTLFLSSTAGMMIGAGLAAATDARPGSISFTFSSGFWGAYAGAMAEGIARGRRSAFPAAGILVGEGVGLAMGMLLSRVVEPTAAQARWMDLGAASGASIGLLLGGLVNNEQAVARSVGSLIGLAGGMALGYVLGRPSPEERQMNRDRDGVAPARPSAFVMPVEGGAVAGLSLM